MVNNTDSLPAEPAAIDNLNSFVLISNPAPGVLKNPADVPPISPEPPPTVGSAGGGATIAVVLKLSGPVVLQLGAASQDVTL